MQDQEPFERAETVPASEKVNSEPAQMSEVATLGNIFLEPGSTFEDLRRKPRFLMGLVIVALLMTGYAFGLYYKLGDAGIRQFVVEQIDKNPQTSAMTGEQKASAIDMQMMFMKIGRFASPIIIAIAMFIGGLLYWGAAKAFGGTGSLLHGLSVFIYSSIPPTVVAMIANFVVLGFKSADEIDFGASQRGVIHASPAILMDGKSMPVLATLVGTLDLFMIWGWVLAAIGLRITNKLSSGSALAIVVIFALVGVMFRVIGAYFSGNPT